MGYWLACDTCAFRRSVAGKERAFVVAGAHEGEHEGHFVVIETVGAANEGAADSGRDG